MEELKPKFNDIIKSVSDNQHEIIYNIMNLHNNGEAFFADMTYSSGKFYEQSKEFYIPQPKVKLDVVPQFDDVLKIDPLAPLPFEDNSIPSIMIDLPFIIAPKDSPSTKRDDGIANKMQNRFAAYYPREDMFDSYYHWISEAYRVLKTDGICVFKCQGTVSGGIQLLTPEYSWLCASLCGFYPKDQFFYVAKARLHSGKIKKQEHARKYTATFWVFKKENKKRDMRYFNKMEESVKEQLSLNFKNIFLNK